MSAADQQTPCRPPSRRRGLPLGCVIPLWVALAAGLVGAWTTQPTVPAAR